MATDVAIRLGVDGEREFKKALSGVDAQIKNLNSELRATVSAMTGMDGAENTTTQKTNILGRSIDATKKKISVLTAEYDRQKGKLGELERALDEAQNAQERDEKAITRATNAYNEQAARVSNLGTRINNATADLNQFEKEMRDIDSAADKASDSLDEMANEAGSVNSSLTDAFTGGAIAGGIQAMVSNLVSLVDETQEYRRIMASLEVSSQSAGYNAEQTAASYRQLYGVLGDEQTAATALANLQALGLSQEQLTDVTDAAIGAWAKYGDSIPIDGLAESINETVKAGQVTGTFADVLNWAGTSEDAFNESLKAAKTPAERMNIVMKELARQGLAQSAQAWRDNNKDLVEANEAAADMNDSLASMSKQVSLIATTLKKAMAEGVGALATGLEFAADHSREFISALAGIGVAAGGLKAASIASDLAGVVSAARAGTAALAAYETATGAATVAQGALSAAMALTPTGALALGLTALVTGLAVYANQTGMAKDESEELSKGLDEIIQKSDEYMTKQEEIAERREEAIAGSMAEINHTQSMVEELNSLVDANGRVRTGEEERARVLANLINEVMPGAVEWIEKQGNAYVQTADNLQLLIDRERINALISANSEGYQEAIKNQQSYLQSMVETTNKIDEMRVGLRELQAQREAARNAGDIEEFDRLGIEIDETKDRISEAKTEYAEFKDLYVEASSTIMQQEDLMAAAASNNSDKMNEALNKYYSGLQTFTGNNLEELQKQQADTEAAYQELVRLSEEYPKTVTQNELDEARNRASQAKIIAEQAGKEETQAHAKGIESKKGDVATASGKVADASAKKLDKKEEARKAGENFTLGFAEGIVGQALEKAVTAAQTMAERLLSTVNKAQDSHSPSRKTMKSGRWFTQGYTIGILSQVPALMSGVRGMVKDLIGVTTDTAETYVKRSSKTITSAVTKEINHLNSKIAEIEAQASEKQAAQELATYKENLKKKNEELAKAETTERQKILAEIAKLESDWNEKQLKAQQDAEKKKLQEQVKTLEQFQKEYESALQEIEKSQESMANKLSDYGELFTTVKEETGSFLELGDLQADIDAINRYGDALEQLKARGVSDSLLEEITGMSIDDATAYTEALLGKTDDEYAAYMALWEQKQKEAQEIARKFYSDEMDALQDEFVDKIPEELGGVKDEMYGIGTMGIEGMISGLYAKSGALYSAARSIVRQAIQAMQSEASVNSPSRKTRDMIGMPLAEGIEVGFLEKMEKAKRNIAAAVMAPIERIRRDDMYNAAAGAVNGMASASAIAPQTVVIPVNLNGKQIAEVVYDPLKQVGKQRGY